MAGDGANIKKAIQCSNCLRFGHSRAICLKDKYYSKLGPALKNPWPAPSITLNLADLICIWDLETTGLSVYHQEPMEIGYAIMRVAKGPEGAHVFERVGSTVSQLTMTNIEASPAAVKTHGITPNELVEGGVPLSLALDTLTKHVQAAKTKKESSIFFLGANSDAYDMRIMQYTLARHSESSEEGNGTEWFDMLTDLGVTGTIDVTRLIPSFGIFDDLKGKSSKSVGNMHLVIVGCPLEGAHRAGTDVDGVVNILCNTKVTERMMSVPSAIPLAGWLAHSTHSKARLDWETRMKAEIEEEGLGEMVTPTVLVSGGAGEDSDDGGESDDSEEYIAEIIVGHTGKNRTRKYTVRWEDCLATDTSDEPARRFGTDLPLELLEKYLVSNPHAKTGHPGHAALLRQLASEAK